MVLYEGLVGEGWQVTEHEGGVDWFHPFASGVLYQARRPAGDKQTARADAFGKFIHFNMEDSETGLYFVGLAELRRYEVAAPSSPLVHGAPPEAPRSVALNAAQLPRGQGGSGRYGHRWRQ